MTPVSLTTERPLSARPPSRPGMPQPVPSLLAFSPRLPSRPTLPLSRGAAAGNVFLSCCGLHRIKGGGLRPAYAGEFPQHAHAPRLQSQRGNAPPLSGSHRRQSGSFSSLSSLPVGHRGRISTSQRLLGRGQDQSSSARWRVSPTAQASRPLLGPHWREPSRSSPSVPAPSSALASPLFRRDVQTPRFQSRRCWTTCSPPASVRLLSLAASLHASPSPNSLSCSAFLCTLSAQCSSTPATPRRSSLSPPLRTPLFCLRHSSPGKQETRLPHPRADSILPLSFSASSPWPSSLPSLPAAPLCAPPLPRAAPAGSGSGRAVAETAAASWPGNRAGAAGVPLRIPGTSRLEGLEGGRRTFSGEECRLFAGPLSQQKRWWTRASGMRNPVKWTRDWEVLNRKVYFAFDEREVRRSMLDAVSAHRKTASLFHKMIDVVPGVAHALSLPGPHTFFLPTDKACTAHLSPETLQALRERIAFLEEQQHQRVEGTRAQIEAAGVASLRGGSAAAIAARVAKTTEQLRTFVLGHVVPGEWRMKTLLLACGAGDPRTNGNLRYQDTERQLFAPVMYASRLNSSGSGEGKKVGRGQGGKDSVNGEAGESERAQDNDEERCSVFSLPPPLSTEDPLPVWIQTSRYAAFLPITTSTNFPSALRPKASTESPSSEETASEDSVAYRQKSSSSVGGAVHLWVGGALVIKADLRAHNGVVHMIDRPLVPAQLLASPK